MNIGETMLTPTGIKDLDIALKGGLIQGKRYLVIGDSGSGKTLFSLKFIVNGAKLHIPGVFVSTTESPKNIITGLKNVGISIENLIDNKMITIFKLNLRVLNDQFFKKDNKFIVENILATIKNEIRKINAKRLVIDSLSSLLPMSLGSRRIDIVFLFISSLEEKTNTTTFLTSDLSIAPFISELVDGVIELSAKVENARILREVIIRKMRWRKDLDFISIPINLI